MTNLEIIKAALSFLGVVSEGEQPTAEQGALGLATLNDMLEDWSAQGIEIGQWPQTDLSAEFPGGPSSEGPTKANLAMYLAPHFAVQVQATLVAMASAGYQRLLRDAMVERLQPVSMGHMPGLNTPWATEISGR